MRILKCFGVAESVSFARYSEMLVENRDFYRAMLICLSIRLSVRHTPVFAGILSKRLNVSANFFFMLGSHTILVFLHTKRYGKLATFRLEPPTGASNEKIAIFG